MYKGSRVGEAVQGTKKGVNVKSRMRELEGRYNMQKKEKGGKMGGGALHSDSHFLKKE